MEKYTDEQKIEIVNKYNEGSLKAYAESVGISRTTFSKWRKKYNVAKTSDIAIVDITDNVKNTRTETSSLISLCINGITINISDDYDESLLIKVLRSIKKI